MNIANLEKLAAYLESLPDDYEYFDMFDFFWIKEQYSGYTRPEVAGLPGDCGAVACAVGHGPAAGIPAHYGEGWNRYSERVFDLPDMAWDWCFSDAWKKVDNTPHGAAARIRYLLANGLPDDAFEQQKGTATYLFAEAE